MLLYYGHPVRKPVIGARDAKMFKNRYYDVASCCTRIHECPEQSRLIHFRLMVWA